MHFSRVIFAKRAWSRCALIVGLLMISVGNTFENRAYAESGTAKQASSVGDLTDEERKWLAENHTVRVRVGEFPPYQIRTPYLAGLSLDLLNAIADRYGFKVAYEPDLVAWPEAMQDVLGPRQRIDLLLTMTRTPERARQFAMTQDYLSMPWVIYTRKGSAFISSIDHLAGKSVSVEKGYLIQEKLQKDVPTIRFLEAANSEEALRAVATGLADAYVGNLAVGAYLIRQSGFANLIVAAPTPYGDHKQAMAIRNDWAALASIIDKGIAAMPAEQRNSLTQKWTQVEVGPQIDYMLVWQILAISALLIAAFIYWNRKLAREIARRIASEAERRQVEDALRASEANYRELIDNVNAIILRMAPDGTVTYFNEYAEHFFGYRADEILGRHGVGTIVPETESSTGRDLSAMMANILANPQQFADNENENITKDGRRVIVRWANQVILDESRKPSGVLSIGTDITAQKQAEELLIRAKDAAESANIAKSQFLATMSHEIRTPMNGIFGMAQMLLMDNIGEAERRDYARTILNSGQTLLTLLNDILDLSKIEAGKLELDKSVIDPGQILHETVNLFQKSAANKGLTLEASGEEGAQRYLADPNRLRQMLSNLTNNAIKFTANGKVTLQAREIERSKDTALIEFSVSDTGIGIEADKLKLLFKPFSQVDSSITRRFGGTGLGLSIVRSLAQKMGGDIGVESNPGQGSRFWFHIRAEVVEAGVNRRHSARVNDVIAINPGQLQGNILVVEDNLINQQVIQAMLKKLGLGCQIAPDGKAGVQSVAQDPSIDLILMDVQMPVMDGYEATRAIRAWETEMQQRHRSIIAMTANAYDEDRQCCLDAGMDDFLTKPVDVDKLTLALQRWLPAAK